MFSFKLLFGMDRDEDVGEIPIWNVIFNEIPQIERKQ